MIMFGILNPQEIETVLQQQVVGRVGCHAEGLTYVVPISYGYDGKYIYGHTVEGMKIQMMRKNPVLCFEVDVMQNMANWKSVIAWGKFEELTEEPGRQQGIRKLHERILPMISSATTKLSDDWPFTPKDINTIKGIVYRIKLTKKTGRFENNSTPSFLGWG
jgi:nitroimidazol reductase NimA-like FMN-containing flavoprotein (pyridoxamine 5'-phosphate oxidase superfamily)